VGEKSLIWFPQVSLANKENPFVLPVLAAAPIPPAQGHQPPANSIQMRFPNIADINQSANSSINQLADRTINKFAPSPRPSKPLNVYTGQNQGDMSFS
jgi:hypothetical protein